MNNGTFFQTTPGFANELYKKSQKVGMTGHLFLCQMAPLKKNTCGEVQFSS